MFTTYPITDNDLPGFPSARYVYVLTGTRAVTVGWEEKVRNVEKEGPKCRTTAFVQRVEIRDLDHLTLGL